MKKNKLLYILTILITLFTFNMNVNAEPDNMNVNAEPEIEDVGAKGLDQTCLAFSRLSKKMGYHSLMLEELDTAKYDMACTYSRYITYGYKNWVGAGGGNIINATNSGCHVIQFNIDGDSGNMKVVYSFPGTVTTYIVPTAYDFIEKVNDNGGKCPPTIYSADPIISYPNSSNSTSTDSSSNAGCYHNGGCSTTGTQNYDASYNTNRTTTVTVKLDNKDNDDPKEYSLSSAIGYNLKTREYFQIDNMVNNFIGDIKEELDCENLFEGTEGEDLKEIIKWIVRIVKIAIPILLIGLGIMDFVKAVFSGKEDEMKKAQEKFIKRIIIGVCIFLIPVLITYILKLYNLVWDKNIDVDFCGILK